MTDTRTAADRIAAVRRHGRPVTDADQAAAAALLTDLYAAAAQHGITPDNLGFLADLPGLALDAIRSRTT